MNVNRPYTFELARQLLAAYRHDVLTDQHHDDIAGHYANAERNGVDRATLDRAAHALQRLAPADVNEWIRQEYLLVDGPDLQRALRGLAMLDSRVVDVEVNR
jgi:hypothetical protein